MPAKGSNAIVRPDSSEIQLKATKLQKAILSCSKHRLQSIVTTLLKDIPEIGEALEAELLVEGKAVIRYHADTDSEEGATDNEESPVDDSGISTRTTKNWRPIAAKDDEIVHRFSNCKNCKGEFDVTRNKKGDCHWHPGTKDINDEDDFWADHDTNCHGEYEDLIDDDDMAEGFIWSCCNTAGDNKGCKLTKHKANINMVVEQTSESYAKPGTQKRKTTSNNASRKVRRLM